MKAFMRRPGRCYHGPAWQQSLSLVADFTFEQENKFWTAVNVERKRGARCKTHELHFTPVRFSQILHFDAFGHRRFSPFSRVRVGDLVFCHTVFYVLLT